MGLIGLDFNACCRMLSAPLPRAVAAGRPAANRPVPEEACGRLLRIPISNMDAAALKARGNAQFAAGDYAAAQASYTEAIRALDAQENPQGLHLLFGNRRAGYYAEAGVQRRHRVLPQPRCRRVAAPRSALPNSLFCCRAASALKLGQWAAALQDTEAALAAEPRWVKAMYRKAAALQGLGQLGAAAAAAQEALRIEPSNRELQALQKQLEQAQGSNAVAPEQRQGGAAAAPPHCGPRRAAPTVALLPPPLARSPWEYVPSGDGVDENLLLLLHGLGDRPAAFASLARRMALPQVSGPGCARGCKTWPPAQTRRYRPCCP